MPVTMNISLNEPLKRFVDKQVREGGYSTSSEYMRELLRKERDREKLRKLLIDGARSGPARPVDEAWFAKLRQHAGARDGT